MKAAKFISLPDRKSYHRLEDVIGCKWSASVIGAVSAGIQRPGELERYIPGISKKVLNERLRKLCAFGLLERAAHAGSPLRVDYTLTPLGGELAKILEHIRALNPLP